MKSGDAIIATLFAYIATQDFRPYQYLGSAGSRVFRHAARTLMLMSKRRHCKIKDDLTQYVDKHTSTF